MAERVLQGRCILVLGGSNGIGLAAVGEFARLGATVYMGASRPESFNRATIQLARREKLDIKTLPIYPFIADVTDKNQLAEAASEVARKGTVLTDVIFSQAAGMENVVARLDKHMDPITEITFATPIDELDDVKKAIVEERLAAMRADLRVWTKEAMPRAIAVNYQGTIDALDVLFEQFPKGFRGIFYNSTWGHLSGAEGVEIPLLYRPVDHSKGLVRDRLDKIGAELALAGFPMAVVIASLVNDTQVGKMFNDFYLNLMDQDQRDAVRSSSIQSRDVVLATSLLLETDPSKWLRMPYNLFVYRSLGEVVLANSLEQSAMYTKPYRF